MTGNEYFPYQKLAMAVLQGALFDITNHRVKKTVRADAYNFFSTKQCEFWCACARVETQDVVALAKERWST